MIEQVKIELSGKKHIEIIYKDPKYPLDGILVNYFNCVTARDDEKLTHLDRSSFWKDGLKIPLTEETAKFLLDDVASLALLDADIKTLSVIYKRAGRPTPEEERDRWIKEASKVIPTKTLEPVLKKALKHQRLSAQFHLARPCSFDGSQMGTGKTYTAIACMKAVAEPGGLAIVLTPVSVLYQWRNEINSWWGDFSPKPEVTVLDASARAGMNLASLRKYGKDEKAFQVWITNYHHTGIQKILTSLGIEDKLVFMVADESTHIKNSRSLRSKAVFKLSRFAHRRMALSGYNAPNSPFDLFGQYYYLDPRILGPSAWAFKQEYIVSDSMGYPEGFKNLNKLLQKTSPFYIRWEAEECSDLPKRSFVKRELRLGKKQSKIYTDMAELGYAELEEMEDITAAHVLVQSLRLQQIAGGAPGGTRIPDCPKPDALRDIVESSGLRDQILVWAAFIDELDWISKILEEYGEVLRIYGKHNSTAKSRAILQDRFQQGEVKFLVGHPGAGGMGLNLHAANISVYWSSSWNSEHREQSLRRNYRRGQTRPVTVYDLIIGGTTDEIIYASNEKKTALNAYLGRHSWKTLFGKGREEHGTKSKKTRKRRKEQGEKI